jgi:hypothetical protein
MRSLSWTSAALFCLGSAFSGPDANAQSVVINEFLYDEIGVDANEFVELYNATTQAVDISGWMLESRDAGGLNSQFLVPNATVLPAGGFYVFGSATVANVNQIVGVNDIWENDNEALLLCDSNLQVIDSLVTEAFRGIEVIGEFAEGEGIWGEVFSDPAIPTSLQRSRDGLDTNDNRDFILLPITPGASNNLPVITGIRQRFDSLTVGQSVPGWGGTHATPKVIDPTVANANNPTAIPASGQGGNAAVFWDPTPGSRGNTSMLLSQGETNDVLIECNVYFDATNEPIGERESWSLGVQGSSDSNGATPDPFQYWSIIDNGNTGVAWVYQSTEQGAVLFLVDHNNGASILRPCLSFTLRSRFVLA